MSMYLPLGGGSRCRLPQNSCALRDIRLARGYVHVYTGMKLCTPLRLNHYVYTLGHCNEIYCIQHLVEACGREWKRFLVSLCGGMVGAPHWWDAQRLPGMGGSGSNGFSCSNTSGGNLTALQMLQSTVPHLRTSKE